MASIRTPEQIKQMLEERKRIKEKQKLLQQQRYRKASEAVKKDLARKHKQQLKQQQQTKKEQPQFQFKLTIYTSPLVERFQDEKDLYTKEELLNIETLYPEEEGRLNWPFFNYLVEKVKKDIRCR